MRYFLLACDYDGTIAHHGIVDEPTVAALESARDSGRKLVLVTGRQTDDLIRVFPRTELFDRVVSENGAVVYDPHTGREEVLAEPPPEQFVTALRERGISQLSVGRVIVATWHPHENIVLETIRDLGLEHQVIFNKGAVMVLPAGVNKATGLAAALRDLNLSEHNAVGVGDAENDHAFLALCECSAAVANALPALKERADIVLQEDHGAGVRELIDELIKTDFSNRKVHRYVPFAIRPDGSEMVLPAYGEVILIAGASGSGKSSLATAFMERLANENYQLCVIDPEGDYEFLAQSPTFGTPDHPPTADEVTQLLADPARSAVVNLMGASLPERPAAFSQLLEGLHELRERAGLPHWVVVDEAHHLVPAAGEVAPVPRRHLDGTILITVNPDAVARSVLEQVSIVVSVGEHRAETLASYCTAVGETPPETAPDGAGDALIWHRRAGVPPENFHVPPVHNQQPRHRRKYAEGELPPDRSFYFRGPKHALDLRAHNLMIFLQIADDVDDDTWEFHLGRGDYSVWMRDGIKDEPLAEEVAAVERDQALDANESRAQVRAIVEKRYTAPS